jgi:FkbM family methyltransferase
MGIKKNLFRILPKSWHVPVWSFVQKVSGHAEPEMLRLREFVPRGRMAIDIGANIGLYSHALSRLCPHVEAFEPQPVCLASLNAFAGGRNISVNAMAVSDHDGMMTLHVPDTAGDASGLATFRAPVSGQGGAVKKIEVPVRRLDAFDFRNVGFIKVDVEGHEIEVLRGAEATLLREKPVLMIEIEQRHLDFPMTDIFEWLGARGYRGFYLKGNSGDAKVPLEKFSITADQEAYLADVEAERYSVIRGKYINNFFFVPAI